MMIVGLCRFSFLSTDRGGWESKPSEVEETRRILFDKQRLETRFTFFERYTLPGIRNQTDDDFRFVILASEDMPKPYQDRLVDITRDDPKIRIRTFPVQKSKPLMRKVFAEEFGSADRQISFRIDDDDGLSVDFVRRLRAASRSRTSAKPFFVTFSKGIILFHKGDSVSWSSECAFPFLSMGLAFSTPAGVKRCIYDFKHRACHRDFDALVLSGRPAFIRSIHGLNDTRGKLYGAKRYPRTDLAGIAGKFEREFPYLKAVSGDAGASLPVSGRGRAALDGRRGRR